MFWVEFKLRYMRRRRRHLRACKYKVVITIRDAMFVICVVLAICISVQSDKAIVTSQRVDVNTRCFLQETR